MDESCSKDTKTQESKDNLSSGFLGKGPDKSDIVLDFDGRLHLKLVADQADQEFDKGTK